VIVVGGLYRECCAVPEWDQIYGSGGRAAAALATRVPDVTLYAPCANDFLARAEIAMSGCGVTLKAKPSLGLVTFEYFHPLATPEWNDVPAAETIRVEGEIVIRYGMIEADAVVKARLAVYDPQSDAHQFRANGSSADRLATVLNESDACVLSSNSDPVQGALDLIADKPNDIVVLKKGLRGAEVFTHGGRYLIPPYQSDTVFKIGSGDVFSAAFALHWAKEGLPPELAADLASRATAHYVASRSLPLPPPEKYVHGPAIEQSSPGKVYIAGPFFNLGQRWMIEEAVRALSDLGCPVFSPLHEVGFGEAGVVAPLDLAGLDDCSAVLALLDGGDPGTIFEVGHARCRGLPVIALAEDVHQRDLTMPAGSGCVVTTEFSTAVYRVAWAAMR